MIKTIVAFALVAAVASAKTTYTTPVEFSIDQQGDDDKFLQLEFNCGKLSAFYGSMINPVCWDPNFFSRWFVVDGKTFHAMKSDPTLDDVLLTFHAGDDCDGEIAQTQYKVLVGGEPLAVDVDFLELNDDGEVENEYHCTSVTAIIVEG
eukprot:TRINITY_DN31639_c0_g1_i2.p1 TRINITY_DN31639_c0_g1~~TRINITY_DN31639_c0_g1_i2.p1  ORF type:complete len:149 (+),score=30.04 TRINITY_DN31639_c0_g1_i2:3-449(+)